MKQWKRGTFQCSRVINFLRFLITAQNDVTVVTYERGYNVNDFFLTFTILVNKENKSLRRLIGMNGVALVVRNFVTTDGEKKSKEG